MHEKNENSIQSKPYTGIYEIFGSTPFNNVMYRNNKNSNNDQFITKNNAMNSDKISTIKDTLLVNETPYVTCEKYHRLNRNISYKSMIRSTSTIFCDLDDIAKRHSFSCVTGISASNANILKVMKLPHSPHGFKGRNEAIIQECATRIQPNILAKDSMVINSKKVRKNFPQNDVLSSEIFLRDEFYTNNRHNQYYNIDVTNNRQKFWSYAKYHTDYTKPGLEEKKVKKKGNKGQRTDDPCPCQLFSYACPCSNEKSLTELAKNSKSLTVADQITSTHKITEDPKHRKHLANNKSDKPTSMNNLNKNDYVDAKNEPMLQVAHKADIPILADNNKHQNQHKGKNRPRKKHRKMVCPNCKEKVDIISTTEEELSLQNTDSLVYRSNEMTPTTAYNLSMSSRSERNRVYDNGDVCTHEPRCELVPVCQILPADDVYINSKCTKKRPSPRSTPRVIRITKACRHHPPCTVVPSCQRANVLRNNCEFIPPCLHRPRCVNLPLCVPFTKSIHYEEKQLDDFQDSECLHVPRCQYIPVCQNDSISTNGNRYYNAMSRVQNACELSNGYQASSPFRSKQAFISGSLSPYQMTPTTCCSCRSHKSCQYNCYECSRNSTLTRESSSDAVIFIRDVGCQFQNKVYSPRSSIVQSKTSSASFELQNVKAGNYYTTVHTLRYEDKFTNPKSGIDSMSTDSILSDEIDSHCPSHGRRSKSSKPSSGFTPNSEYVAAFATTECDPTKNLSISEKQKIKGDLPRHRESSFPIKCGKNFIKNKYRKAFATKRKGKLFIHDVQCCVHENVEI